MIPLAAPQVPAAGVDRVQSLLESGTLSTQEVVAEFEAAFSTLCEREHGVAVASGSVALELALEAAFDRKEQVALSPYNCGAVLYAIRRADLTPVFVDADGETGAISPSALRDVNVDGVVLSHLFGHPAKVGPILDAAAAIDAKVVEDFAQAPGATYEGRPTGSFGRIGVCSFGATKNVTTAEGGMVVTDDPDLTEYVRYQRSNVEDRSPPPRSVRMSDLEAAIGLAHLEAYEERIERKRAIAETYRERLSTLDLPLLDDAATHVYHAFPVLSEGADDLATHLRSSGVETSRLYDLPLHEYDVAPAVTDEFPGARYFSDEVVLLPIYAGLADEQVERVVTAVQSSNQGTNQ